MEARKVEFKQTDFNTPFLKNNLFLPVDVPQYEADALVNFYNSGNGDNWNDNTGWKTDPVVGNWYGITVKDGHVTEIDLNNDNNITGDIKYLQNLKSLVDLHLGNTLVLGDISALQNLTRLTSLRLYSTSIVGDIVALQNLIKLTRLNLNNTEVTGDIVVIQNLTNLIVLNLYNTAISGDIIALQNLTSLTGLKLNGTAVTGNAFIIQFLPNLSGTNSWDGFRVDDTNVSSYTQGTIPALTCYINLSKLGLSQTEIDNFLVDMDNSGSTDCPIYVSGNSAPSQTGLDAIASLEGKGCTITYDT